MDDVCCMMNILHNGKGMCVMMEAWYVFCDGRGLLSVVPRQSCGV